MDLRFKFQAQRLIPMHRLSFSRILLMVFYKTGIKRWGQVISKLAKLKGIKFMLIEKQAYRSQTLPCLWEEINLAFLPSHESIYQHIYADKDSGGSIYKYLRCIGTL